MTPLARKQRPRRVASDEAHSWARNLRLRNTIAKLTLMMLTLYVDGDGACFVGASSLAEDCEISVETVRRRLAWLESIGAIARFPQWIDENGMRNGEGRGKRTSDKIRLMLDADPDEIEARANGADVVDEQDGSTEITPLHGRGLNAPPETGEMCPAPSLGVCQPPHCGGGIDSSNHEPEDSPQAPQGGPSEIDDDREEENNTEIDGWDAFKTSFEADGSPIMRVSLAKTLFGALSAEQRSKVTRAANGLIAYRSRQKKPGTKPSAQTFLRETDAWDGFEKHAPPAPVVRVVLARGTEAFRIAAVYKLLLTRSPIIGDSIEIPERLIASKDIAALGQFADENGEVSRDNWRQLDPECTADKAMIAAWRERIKAWSGVWMEFEEVKVLNADGTPKVSIKEWQGRELHFPVKRKALIVPCDWPPRADGSWPETLQKTG